MFDIIILLLGMKGSENEGRIKRNPHFGKMFVPCIEYQQMESKEVVAARSPNKKLKDCHNLSLPTIHRPRVFEVEPSEPPSPMLPKPKKAVKLPAATKQAKLVKTSLR